MARIRIFAAALVLASLSGCFASMKQHSNAFLVDSGGSLSVWEAEMSAAVAYPDGQMCMQRALTAKAIDAQGSANVSAAILQLAGAVQTAKASGEDLASITGSLKETVTLLTTSTERTAFLDLGLFYVCQMSANGALTDTQTAEVIRTLALAAATISTNAPNDTLQILLEDKVTAGENTLTPKQSAAAALGAASAPKK